MYLYEIIQLIAILNKYDLNPYLQSILTYIHDSNPDIYIIKENVLDNFAILDPDTLSQETPNRIEFEDIGTKIKEIKEKDILKEKNNTTSQNTEDILSKDMVNSYLDEYKEICASNTEINLRPFTFNKNQDEVINFDIDFLLIKNEEFKKIIDSIPYDDEQKLRLLKAFLSYAVLINSLYFFKNYWFRRKLSYGAGLFGKVRNVYKEFKINVLYLKRSIDELSQQSYAGGATIHKKIIKNKTKTRK